MPLFGGSARDKKNRRGGETLRHTKRVLLSRLRRTILPFLILFSLALAGRFLSFLRPGKRLGPIPCDQYLGQPSRGLRIQANISATSANRGSLPQLDSQRSAAVRAFVQQRLQHLSIHHFLGPLTFQPAYSITPDPAQRFLSNFHSPRTAEFIE